MSNYTAEAATYSGKVASLQAAIAQVKGNLDSAKSKLSGMEDSVLKSNVVSGIESIKSKLDSIISEAQSNASKVSVKARELDEENRRKAALNTTPNLNGSNASTTGNDVPSADKTIDNRLNGEGTAKPQAQKAIDNHLGEAPPTKPTTPTISGNNGGLTRYV